jgi:hypothetical protein
MPNAEYARKIYGHDNDEDCHDSLKRNRSYSQSLSMGLVLIFWMEISPHSGLDPFTFQIFGRRGVSLGNTPFNGRLQIRQEPEIQLDEFFIVGDGPDSLEQFPAFPDIAKI